MWDRFVDIVTIVWLTVFFVGIANPDLTLDVVEFSLLGVFVVDLGVKYRRAAGRRTFFRKHWNDILMVIPYFRIFRILKLFRLLRILKMVKIARVGRNPGVKPVVGFAKKSLRLRRRARERRND